MSPKRTRHSSRPGPPRRRERLPDLRPILGRFDAALAIAAVAHIAIQASEQLVQEELALRQGLAALNAVHTELDRADLQLDHFRTGAQ